MCGIVGFWGGDFTQSDAHVLLQAMASQLRHRGPDDAGVWFDAHSQIGLGHRRLSILDLSLAGHQPMHSRSNRYILVFNGEIYNHLVLRDELNQKVSIEWNGHSDTQTLLECFEVWGIEKTLQKTEGMFALALWDKHTQTLTLARDRMGEKPLYYGWSGKCFLFASELKGLKPHPNFNATLNKGAIALLLRHNYIPTPYSIYEHVNKLEQGCYLTIFKDGGEIKKTYWSLQESISTAKQKPFQGSFLEAKESLDFVLKKSIGSEMLSDVPLGAFLSGGVDSSIVVSLMQAQSMQKIKTFSIGFEEERFNEAPFAKAIAEHLGTDHTELYVSSKDALNVIPTLTTLYDEPFADSSQIPTFLVAQLAKTKVSVALSGDGADELFGGYNRYTMTHNLWNKIIKMPLFTRKIVAKGLDVLPLELLNAVSLKSYAHLGDKMRKGTQLLTCKTMEELYLKLVSHELFPEKMLLNVQEPKTVLNSKQTHFHTLGRIETMMAYDAISYLPDDILVKVDRAAMAVSLETRVPFLNHNVVEFAWSLPFGMKFHQGEGKYILKELLYDYVPKKLIDRPKMGFGIPLEHWLRNELKEWAEELLDERRLREEGFFNVPLVRKRWHEHLTCKQNWAYHLWDILMFQAWLDAQ
ncbi:asparagine synthase (glutamine-hydrolyzing) [Sulfurospirillum barnesii]|uniref:asparagine synthase (glutamine-hydrolyzing) n=1 Tax=Sulfurospirillum barnesii (strain ATCC 700032 / DSM 10660 / SES-3) TaxID=760154 RepID=I3XYX8_SULBS|nr:asparagine synthase (glutamine-hydrolyzing) [Sulfurospirillum barnesii]AFL69152.1 asparagine synthase, glutamine-hydrolyzing [Sulfurospirillum barnesii SES-3]